jgi:hypothetical protein
MTGIWSAKLPQELVNPPGVVILWIHSLSETGIDNQRVRELAEELHPPPGCF